MRLAATRPLLALGALLLLSAFSLLGPVRAHADGKQDFTLINKTGLVISYVYVSPHDTDTWGEDIMGKDVIGDGESQDITFDPTEEAKLWDLKCVDDKGDSHIWGKLNLMKISKITLTIKDGTAYETDDAGE